MRFLLVALFVLALVSVVFLSMQTAQGEETQFRVLKSKIPEPAGLSQPLQSGELQENVSVSGERAKLLVGAQKKINEAKSLFSEMKRVSPAGGFDCSNAETYGILLDRTEVIREKITSAVSSFEKAGDSQDADYWKNYLEGFDEGVERAKKELSAC
ncbi:hypothetical protein HZC09_05970 [Candidatus Micrarchaeota archaeon]|nr:hypothetical protein [Candidatus Micrarchaeota archaeon]